MYFWLHSLHFVCYDLLLVFEQTEKTESENLEISSENTTHEYKESADSSSNVYDSFSQSTGNAYGSVNLPSRLWNKKSYSKSSRAVVLNVVCMPHRKAICCLMDIIQTTECEWKFLKSTVSHYLFSSQFDYHLLDIVMRFQVKT